jgi:hypothetical protein
MFLKDRHTRIERFLNKTFREVGGPMTYKEKVEWRTSYEEEFYYK